MISTIVHAARDAALPIVGRHIGAPRFEPDQVTLVLQPDHLGDILLSQPAVMLLRDAFPEDRLIAVVGPWSAQIARLAWPVDEVITVEFPGFSRSESSGMWNPYRQLLVDRDRLLPLRARRAVVLRPDAWWAAWLGRLIAPEVVGSADPRVASFATTTASLDDGAHASARAYHIAASANVAGSGPVTTEWKTHPLMLPPVLAGDDLRLLLDRHGVDGRYVIIHPGSGGAVKEWPPHRWRAVAAALVTQGYRVMVTGSITEREIASKVASSLTGVVSVAGETDIALLASLMAGAVAVLGCDSGPLHLAVAAGVPTVHLFGPSDPVRYGPWENPEKHRVVRAGWTCPRCGDLSPARSTGCGCMLAIQPDDVIAIALGLLNVSVE